MLFFDLMIIGFSKTEPILGNDLNPVKLLAIV